MQSSTCLNCDNPVQPAQNFCAACGQKLPVHRLSMHEVAHEALHYFTHADKGIFSLLRELALRPGKVAREYVEGKRRKYFPPINFFFIVAAMSALISGLVLSGIHTKQTTQPVIQHTETTAKPDAKQLVNERSVKANNFVGKYPNLITIVAMPFLSFLMWLFYIRGRYNFTEHLVANMYIIGFSIVIYAFIVNPIQKLMNLPAANLVVLAYFIFEVVYRIISYYQFIDKKTTWALVKIIFVSCVVTMVWILFSAQIIEGYKQGWFS